MLEINKQGPSPTYFSPDLAIAYDQSGRRPNQKPRKEYQRRQKGDTGGSSTEEESEAEALDIEKWDSWFDDDSQQA